MVLSNSFVGITSRVFTSSKAISIYLHSGTTVYQRPQKYEVNKENIKHGSLVI